MTDATTHSSHVTRMSDSSRFDEICVLCQATDEAPVEGVWPLHQPCPVGRQFSATHDVQRKPGGRTYANTLAAECSHCGADIMGKLKRECPSPALKALRAEEVKPVIQSVVRADRDLRPVGKTTEIIFDGDCFILRESDAAVLKAEIKARARNLANGIPQKTPRTQPKTETTAAAATDELVKVLAEDAGERVVALHKALQSVTELSLFYMKELAALQSKKVKK